MKLLRLLVIGGTGLALGLLFAPKPGWELRAELVTRLRALMSGETEPVYVTPSQAWDDPDLDAGTMQAKVDEARDRLKRELSDATGADDPTLS